MIARRVSLRSVALMELVMVRVSVDFTRTQLCVLERCVPWGLR